MATRNGRKAAERGAWSFHYIPCQIEPGMFHGEWLVFVKSTDAAQGRTIITKLLADERDVKYSGPAPKRGKPVSGWLRVSWLGKEGAYAKVVLPQPANPSGESILIDQESVKQEVPV